jgi:hypothetical protein
MSHNIDDIGREIIVRVAQYYITKSIDQVVASLHGFWGTIEPVEEGETVTDPKFPSVCIVGLGRCGSNIALGVSTLVYQARLAWQPPVEKDGAEVDNPIDIPTEKTYIAIKENLTDNSIKLYGWFKSRILGDKNGEKTPVYLVEPIVIVGDLDIDINGRIDFTKHKELIEAGYRKLKLLDLSEIHHGGAGNVPIIGQYLAKVVLNRDSSSFKDKNWKYYHSYLIDSPGLKENQSRLFFYIFSAGGGTGSGMGGEFGLAQQYAYHSRIRDYSTQERAGESNAEGKSQGFEPIFSSGIAILPHFNHAGGEYAQAIHINAGRLICKYLSEEWQFNQSNPKEDAKAGRELILRPWNALMLISNNIMRYVEQQQEEQPVDVTLMEKYANQYVSQQIFNILSAQALTTDYDEAYFRNTDIDIGNDTIRLDANDLYMSLAGPVAIAYAESTPPDDAGNNFDINDVFYRSISLPSFSEETQAIEGISILPQPVNKYKETLRKFKENNFHRSSLEGVKFFVNCASTVTIISIPKGYKLPWNELNKLKASLDNVFPHTKLKRYALIIGASRYLSLTTIIANSPCLCEEVITLLFAYLKRCFAKEEYKYTSKMEEEVTSYIIQREKDENQIKEVFKESEDPSEVMVANWEEVKSTCERKYSDFLNDPDKFIPMDDIRLKVDDVLNALKYISKTLRHQGVPMNLPDVTSWQVNDN